MTRMTRSEVFSPVITCECPRAIELKTRKVDDPITRTHSGVGPGPGPTQVLDHMVLVQVPAHAGARVPYRTWA